MRLNHAFAGREYPPTPPRRIEEHEIRSFAAVLGTPTTGGAAPLAPATFAIVLSLPADDQVVRDPQLGLDYRRVLHREQSFVHHCPIRAGDVLTVRVRVADVRSAGRREILVTQAEIETVSGAPVCTVTTTLIVQPAGTPA